MSKRDFSITRLRECLKYDSDTGGFVWLISKGTRAKNARAGAVGPDGYVYIGMDNKKIAGHIAAWMIYYGECPAKDIDHINGICSDNRINNLRLVSMRENQQNTHMHRAGRLPGATFRGPNKWEAQIRTPNGKLHLGTFKTEQEAHEVYMRKAKEIEHA